METASPSRKKIIHGAIETLESQHIVIEEDKHYLKIACDFEKLYQAMISSVTP